MKNQSKIKIADTYKKQFNQSHYYKWILLVLFFACVFFLLYTGIAPGTIDLEAGDTATENIVAPRRIIDVKLTEALRVQAENLTAPVYDYIPSTYANAKSQITILFETVRNAHIEHLDQVSVDSFNEISGVDLTLDDYAYLIQSSSSTIDKIEHAVSEILDDVYGTEIKAIDISASKQAASDMVDNYDLNATQTAIAKSIVYSSVNPNMIFNAEATQIAQQSARESVNEVVYEAGQTIISRGDIVTEDQIQLLKDSGMIRSGLFQDLSNTVGLPLLLLILIGLFISYLYFYHKDILNSNKMITLLAIQFVLMLFIGQLCGYFSVYLIPISLMTMTLCVVFSSRVAVQTNLFLMLFLAVSLQLDIDSFIFLSVSGYVGIVYMRNISNRTDIFKTGLLVSVVNIILIMAISAFRNNIDIGILTELFYGIGNGLIAAILTSALLMLWEGVFNIVTPFKLLEMTNPTDDLMQKLITEAPGTYHHSLVVSNMAESAAKDVKANLLLTRVGAYYHDIGKAEKAIYFKENQTEESNPHDFIVPEVSAKILKNHVDDGVYLAEKNRIPEEITDFIRTHHGTSEISYFKQKAEENGYDGDEDFRYHGILPTSKETSIVMLADSIEAAVRSLDHRDADSIRQTIDSIIYKKMNEGQLTESELSFAEIEQIKETFFDVLLGVYHSRIKYPDLQTEEKEEEIND